MKKKTSYIPDIGIYKEQISVPSKERKSACRKRVLECADKTTYFMTDGQFLFYQIRFMKKRTVLGQLLVMAIAAYMVANSMELYSEYWHIFSGISAVTPLFLVFQVEELARIYAGGMLELETATKFSLKKLLVARIMVLGFSDIAALSVFIYFTRMQLRENLLAILLYSLVPFQICLVIIFLLLVREDREAFMLKAVASIGLVSFLFWNMAVGNVNIYDEGYLMFWVFAFFVTAFMVAGLFGKMKKQAERFSALLAV